MKKLIPFGLLFFIAVSFTACMDAVTGEGPVKEQSRELAAFNKVAVNMNATILITDSPEQSVVIKGQQNILDVIMTRVEGKTLVITTKGSIIMSDPIIIEINIHKPEIFEMNGSGDLITQNTLENDMIDFEVNGSGSVKASVKVNQLTGAISGSGKMQIKGIADDFKIQVNGSGEVDCSSLNCLTASVKINGSGDVMLKVENQLDVNINGSGNVKYTGSPKVNETIRGSGSVVGGGGL